MAFKEHSAMMTGAGPQLELLAKIWRPLKSVRQDRTGATTNQGFLPSYTQSLMWETLLAPRVAASKTSIANRAP